jgi:predicted AAA+ superfamily ATPase
MQKYNDYIKESSFPQVLEFNGNREIISAYLKDSVYLNTIQKDIVKRFNISDTTKLDNVARYLFDNIGNETSLRNIERSLKADGRNVSVVTIDIYVKGLIDSYLLYKCQRYNIKGKKLLESNDKYYVADIALRAALLGQQDSDAGRALENIVYLELLRRGYTVSIGKIDKGNKTLEVDFVAAKSTGEIEYYQVALSALDPNTLQRELAPMEIIKDNYPKFLLTMDIGNGSNNGIKRINVLNWLIE